MTEKPILTDDQGRPFPRPESPGPNANLSERIAYMNALYAYNDAVAATASRAFAEQLTKSLRRRSKA